MSGRKRANGEGTIYRRADGRYEGAAVVPVRGGVRRRVRVYAMSRKEARAKLDRVLDDARQGIPQATHKQTVATTSTTGSHTWSSRSCARAATAATR